MYIPCRAILVSHILDQGNHVLKRIRWKMNMKIKDTEYGREEASEPEKPVYLHHSDFSSTRSKESKLPTGLCQGCTVSSAFTHCFFSPGRVAAGASGL